MDNLLTICQNVADEAGFAKPATIISNNDVTARQLLALLHRAGERLMRKANWQVLIKEATITTISGTSTYALESDYDRHITDTFWDRSNYWKLRGALPAHIWQFYKSGIVSAGIIKKFRIIANLVNIEPEPSAVETLVYEYIMSTWVTDLNGANPAKKFIVDTDLPVIDDEMLKMSLKWRFLKAKGLDYTEEYNEYIVAENQLEARDGGGQPMLDMGGNHLKGGPTLPGIPESGFGS